MLAQKALLVQVSISQWTGRKLDARATGTVENSFNTDGRVGNYTKKLLPDAKELEAIHRSASAIRAFVQERTLPWCADGARILSSASYMEFTAELRKLRGAFEQAVSDFLQAYPQLKASAAARLGSLYNALEYPSEAQLRRAFACDVAFLPMPDVKDFRVALSEDEKAEFISKMKAVEADAIRECWTRLHGVVAKAADKLRTPDAVFRDSLLENVSELCALLPKLNVMDDPELETMRQAVESVIARTNADDCRKIPEVRQEAAAKLSEIESKMSAFMGYMSADSERGAA